MFFKISVLIYNMVNIDSFKVDRQNRFESSTIFKSYRALRPKRIRTGTSLVVQWLRIRLPVQGTWVQALVQEDPTCHGATKPVRHNYWACALEPLSHNCWAHELQLLKLVCSRACVPQLLSPCAAAPEACMWLEPVLCNKRSYCDEKPMHRNEE